MKPTWLLLATLAAITLPAAAEPAPRSRKLITTGWDSPDTAQFRRDLAALEQSPFDGAVLYALGHDPAGRAFDTRPAFGTNHWAPESLAAALADLRAAHPTNLTDNFLILGANPGSVDWFDDAGWKEIVEHCRLLARLARQGGLRGLLFDPEPYTEPFRQFKYRAQPQQARHSFADYSRQARRRGREVMRAVTTEFPQVVFYTYFLFGECARVLVPGGDAPARLAEQSYGLLPAFADGWLDVLPPTATLIDGNERAYRYNSEAAFDAAYVELKNACQSLVAPENRAKFRAQLQVSHGIYLDAYVNPPGSSWYLDGLGGRRVDRLEANVASALRAADEYVWIYGEKARWWPPRAPDAQPAPTWTSVLPGADLALLNAKDPAAGARRELAELRARGALTNRLANGDFAAADQGRPQAWSTWQNEKESHGQFRYDAAVGAGAPGSACLSGVRDGCFVQSVAVQPGQRFLVSGRVRQSGEGLPRLTIRWQTSDGAWTAESRDAPLALPPADGASAWREIIGRVVVPQGAGRLVVLLGVGGERDPADRVWFDDVLLAPASP